MCREASCDMAKVDYCYFNHTTRITILINKVRRSGHEAVWLVTKVKEVRKGEEMMFSGDLRRVSHGPKILRRFPLDDRTWGCASKFS